MKCLKNITATINKLGLLLLSLGVCVYVCVCVSVNGHTTLPVCLLHKCCYCFCIFYLFMLLGKKVSRYSFKGVKKWKTLALRY